MRQFILVFMAVVAVARAADVDFVPEVAREAAAEGSAAFEKGDYGQAVKAYRRMVDLAPDNLVGLVNLGMAETRAGESDAAEKTLLHAIDVRLETGPAWLALGMLYFEKRKMDNAFAALAQATLYDEGNPRAHQYLGVVLASRGWYDGAAAELRRAVQIDPAYRDAHYNLAVVYLEQKPPSIELARRHYFRSIELGGQKDERIEKTLSAPAEDR